MTHAPPGLDDAEIVAGLGSMICDFVAYELVGWAAVVVTGHRV